MPSREFGTRGSTGIIRLARLKPWRRPRRVASGPPHMVLDLVGFLDALPIAEYGQGQERGRAEAVDPKPSAK